MGGGVRQLALLHEDSLDSEDKTVEMLEVNYLGVFKSVWVMCFVETAVFLMTFS